MLELLLAGLLVSTWIVFVAYGAWFLSSAREEGRKRFSELYNSSKDAMVISARRKRKKQERISRLISAPEQVRKLISKPPKRPESVREMHASAKQEKTVPRTEEAIHCIYCGEKLPSYAAYCRKCGEKVE